MTVAEMSASHQNAITSTFERLNNKQRIHPAGTHNPDSPHVRRMLKSGYPGQIRSGVSAPIAEKRNNFGLSLFHIHPYRIVVEIL
jgi:hypothetical protein